MFEDIEFVPEEEINDRPPEGTTAIVKVRPERDGVLGEFRTGESKYGKWMLVPFEVTAGEYSGSWASLMLSVDGKDRRFRAVFQAVTGADITQGASVSFADFRDKLITGLFEAKLGPEKRKGEETGFTSVIRLERRVGERDDEFAGEAVTAVDPIDASTVSASTGTSDEDIPF
jgi:hypothetical protein